MADGYLNFDTKVNSSGFNKGINRLSSLAKSGVAAVGAALAGVTAALSVGTVAGVKYNATIEQYQTSFEVMTGSAEKASDIVSKLTKIGAETPFEMTGLADTTQLLMNYGLSADDAMDKMMMLGDISQGSADKMNRISMAYGQMSSAGKVQLEDIKQMIEAGFNPLQEISQTTGESMASLYDRISKGKISVDEITASMERSTSEGGKYFQSMEKQSKTVSGQLSTLSDNAQQLLGSLTSGISKVLGENILPAINDMLGGLNDAFENGGFQGFLDELGNSIPVIQGVTDAIGKLAEKLQGMSGNELSSLAKGFLGISATIPVLTVGAGAVAGVVSGINSIIGASVGILGGFAMKMATATGTATLFGGAIRKAALFSSIFMKSLSIAGGIGLVLAGLGLLYNAFGDEIDNILLMVQTKGPEIVTKFCNGIVSKLPNLISQGATLVMHLLQAITANIPAIIAGGIQIIAALVIGIAQQLPQLVPTALQMILTLVQALISNLPQLIGAGLQLIVGLAQGVINAVPMLISAIPTIIQSLVSGIVQNLPTIIMTGIQLLIALVVGIIEAIPQLLNALPEIFNAFVEGIKSVDWLSVGKQILTAIAEGIKSIGSSLWDAVTSIFDDGGDKAEEKGKQTGQKYAQGVDSTTANAQVSASNVANSATNSFASTLDLNGSTINLAAMNLGNNADTGLQLANVPGAFQANAQAAANGLSSTLDMNAMTASLSAMNLGTNANSGINTANMGGTFSSAGTQAGQSLGASLANESGTVAGAAGQVANSAQNSLSGIDLGGTYANAGSQAMQSLAGSISAGGNAVNAAGRSAGAAALTGLTSAQMQVKAKTEGTNFSKALADSIKAGTGSIRSAVVAVMNVAKTSANGLGTSGYTIGSQFSEGIARGIKSGKTNISSAAAEVARAAAEAAKANLDINSPSRVGAWIGEMFDKGVAEGLIGNVGMVAKGIMHMTGMIDTKTQEAMKAMQYKAAIGNTVVAGGLYSSATSKAYNQPGTNSAWILDEWERRQRRINEERDNRPVLIDGRRVDRSFKQKGGAAI